MTIQPTAKAEQTMLGITIEAFMNADKGVNGNLLPSEHNTSHSNTTTGGKKTQPITLPSTAKRATLSNSHGGLSG
jgi:hypothetical protein